MTTNLLPRQAPDGHAQEVVVVGETGSSSRAVFTLILVLLDDVLGLASGLRLGHLGEGPELLLAELGYDIDLATVGDDELFVDDHLHEASLVVQLVKLGLQLVREEVL